MYQSLSLINAAFTLTVAGSAFEATHFRSHLCVHFHYGLIIRSCPFDKGVGRLQHLGFPPCCYPSYRVPTLTLAGFSPAEYASLRWTHNPPCRFLATGSSNIDLQQCQLVHIVVRYGYLGYDQWVIGLYCVELFPAQFPFLAPCT